jgi:hypothetical protein
MRRSILDVRVEWLLILIAFLIEASAYLPEVDENKPPVG